MNFRFVDFPATGVKMRKETKKKCIKNSFYRKIFAIKTLEMLQKAFNDDCYNKEMTKTRMLEWYKFSHKV